MTCIIHGAKTKKDLREQLKSGPGKIFIENPSIFPTGTFEFDGPAVDLPVGKRVIVTNHPKRSWFAKIERTKDGFKVT